MERWLRIGRLAAEAQVSADTIRYYESVDLLPAPARSPAGYRQYARADVRRLRLIKRAKLLGLSLDEIKVLVAETFTGSCAHLQTALLDRIPAQLGEIERRIAELQTLREELSTLQTQLASLGVIPAGEVVAECAYCPVVEGTPRRDAAVVLVGSSSEFREAQHYGPAKRQGTHLL